MYNFKEQDWKLFRKKLPVWQENYMGKLIREYSEILNKKALPSEKFWELAKRIKEDKKSVGVQAVMKRSMMLENILFLINDEAIWLEDLAEFSEELYNTVKDILRYRNNENR